MYIYIHTHRDQALLNCILITIFENRTFLFRKYQLTYRSKNC